MVSLKNYLSSKKLEELGHNKLVYYYRVNFHTNGVETQRKELKPRRD